MGKLLKKMRLLALGFLLLVSIILAMVRLMKIQIVEGENLLKLSINNISGTQEIIASRGEIVDINGNPLVANRVAFDIIIEKAFFPDDKQEQNQIILKLAKMLQNEGIEWEESIPITKAKPYEYIEGKDSLKSKVLTDLRLNSYATPQNCIDKLVSEFEISENYSEEEIRIIAGIRYEMIYTQFSVGNRFTFAKDIPQETVSKIEELSFLYPGADVVESAIRIYPNGTVFPHGLGTVGPIYAEEYSALKKLGYQLNDTIGKSGIEKIMEDSLRGKNGESYVTLSSDKNVVSIKEKTPAVPGNTVMLTIDSEFQTKVEGILEEHIKWLNETQTELDKGVDAYGGAIVVLDVKTGAVKAMVSYPNYDINDYIDDYNSVSNAENQPLFNRALDGLYRPGSTFKAITATAALNDGIIDENSTVYCGGTYTYYGDGFEPKCWKLSGHGDENVKTALRDSCNIFFYDVGRRLGITKLTECETQFGFGTDLGFELGGKTGQIASPETFKKLNMTWNPGDIVQASIGQSEIGVTPLHMAVEALTLANKGVRYKPYIIDSVWNYDRSELVNKTKPVVEEVVEDKTGKTFDIIKEGMIMVGDQPSIYPGDTSPVLPFKMALKTGSPQVSTKIFNSAVIGYYPADNPEIAFAVMEDKGWNSKMTAKKIVQAYYGLDTVVQDDQILLP